MPVNKGPKFSWLGFNFFPLCVYMPEPPQLTPLDVKEQRRLNSELPPSDRASHPISKGAAQPSHPMEEETHFSCLYLLKQKQEFFSGPPPGEVAREASRGHLKQMPEPPQLTPLDVKEQQALLRAPPETTSSAKSRDKILWFPKLDSLRPLATRLEILSIKIMNRTGDKGQPCRSPTCTENRGVYQPRQPHNIQRLEGTQGGSHPPPVPCHRGACTELPQSPQPPSSVEGVSGGIEGDPRGIPSTIRQYPQLRLDLGWVVVGDVCLGGAHRPLEVRSYKTAILENGRASHLQPCNNQIRVKEVFGQAPKHQHHPVPTSACSSMILVGDRVGQTVFARTPDDHRLAPSMEDLEFLKIMEAECYQDSSKSWVAPLPFRSLRQRLPNNRKQAFDRLVSLRRSLEKRPQMKADFLEFMEKMLKKAHAEVAPPVQPGQECWYLPLFGVYHPRKPNKIRVVFDSSASCEGVSLNDVLLTSPDLNNSLLGVLMRFRKEQVAITADIEHMFHCFVVKEDHRNLLPVV
ncbi:hypothetical protein L3Q82_007361 [Scortum barcoo]|uniref:Uncharacterized protein n=1 Tax=Scortum barcoo TaxID=214431 RepID=A0ACB8WS20_9TELE|nr:hypothetical protein L3Q82_007361 [Scortum barcoo]